MDSSVLKLSNWLSPGFPVGAFSYSHGLEWAVSSGAVDDRASAMEWIESCLCHGSGRNDAILLVHAMRCDDVAELDALARALAPSRERLLETEAQGTAFCETVAGVSGDTSSRLSYPVAIGVAARGAGCPDRETVLLYLHAFCANLVSACIRLVPLGQLDGQRIITTLHPTIETVAKEALVATLDDLGSSAVMADIASMRHETQSVRLFRS